MSRKRLSKTQLKRDRFVEQTFDWAHWVETHRREVLGGLVAAVLVVAGFFVWRSMQASASEAAVRDYLSARQAFDSGNWALAVNDLQVFVQRHGGSRYGDDAQFFLASAYYRSGQMEQAVQELRDFLDEHDGSGFEDNARRLLAAAYQGLGQFEQAAEVYRAAIENAAFDEQEMHLRAELAAVYLAQNRRDLAADQYRQILEIESEGPIADEARRLYAELTVQPLAGPVGEPGDAAAPGSPAGSGSESLIGAPAAQDRDTTPATAGGTP